MSTSLRDEVLVVAANLGRLAAEMRLDERLR